MRDGATVWLFGSRARGDFRPTSDFDILFSYPSGHNPSPGLIPEVISAMEESRFPYFVDLVAVRNLAKGFEAGIMKDRILIS